MKGGAKAAIIGACVAAALYGALYLLPPAAKGAGGGLEQHIAHDNFACTRDVEGRAAELAAEGDLSAAKILVKDKVANGDCVFLDAGQAVYVEDRSADGLVKVRSPSGPQAYWMPAKGIEP